jgi:dipeptidyl aminopeptidase/acylaminoacyl peptidase
LASRSPINHVDQLDCPVIFFQGSDDKVVPPTQSQQMVAALRDKGIPVAYLEFAGEGHGFRRADNIVRALEAEYQFFCRVFEIEPAAPLTTLEIENL